ncbi:FAD-dependent oxidoreductase [Ktedonobacter racemifer]|uniref:Monooxygenase FAD-binding n=1 Tax=Ktedonobacter racemifer DSM 44963 TaxID=485913 RepID=D6TSU9_KTERA|nr:FAD-dependent monooxygenase [Ktedonobacter racemifer]EFH83500.1 monooxygenase FAD-binding [Ktedonobacter racemifer DSM 44963]
METSRRKALIIGCGIAGPVVAMFLQRAGFEAEIYEARSRPDDYAGLFLNMASNGLDVLQSLGLDGPVKAEGSPVPRMLMRSGKGKHLGEIHNGAPKSQGGESVIITRGTLNRILREEAMCRGITIHFSKRLSSIKIVNEQQVSASFEDGTIASGNLLVGCDGIHSRARQFMVPHISQPLYTGVMGYGGFAYNSTIPPTPGVQHFIFGERAAFGYHVKASGEIYWFINSPSPQEPGKTELSTITNDEWKKRFLAWFSEDDPLIQEIIHATESDIGVYPVYDIPSLPAWHKGPVVCVGDAAHATAPSSGQGASMALEDAIVLAKCVRDMTSLEKAFAMYERLRRKRAEKIVRSARNRGRNQMASNPVQLWFRDLMMSFFLKHFASSNSLAWIYSYRVDWDQKVV